MLSGEDRRGYIRFGRGDETPTVPPHRAAACVPGRVKAIVIDLRGVPCPTSWARARVRLEGLCRGAEAELIVDDPKGARDIPRAAEAQGYAVVGVEADGAEWRIHLAV